MTVHNSGTTEIEFRGGAEMLGKFVNVTVKDYDGALYGTVTE